MTQVPELKNFIGIPFKEMGRTFAGCDCYGLHRLIRIYATKKDMGLHLGYPSIDSPLVADMLEKQKSTGLWVPVSSPEFLDVITFNINGKMKHIGTYIEDGMMLHTAFKLVNSCSQKIESIGWSKRIEGIYRYVG